MQSRRGPQVFTRPMFGALAVYVGDKIVFILRNRDEKKTSRDNGVWVAMPPEHTKTLCKEFPSLRPIELFENMGKKNLPTWLNLPATDDRFEETALNFCELVINADERIGKIPKPKKRKQG